MKIGIAVDGNTGLDPSTVRAPQGIQSGGALREWDRQMVYKSRWAPDEKIRIVLESLNTNISTAELCRKHGVRPPSFYSQREKFLQGRKLALSGQLRDPAKEIDAENERLKKLIGGAQQPTTLLKNAGGDREERLAVIASMREVGVSLRDSLRYSGSSWNLYYHRAKVRQMIDPDLRVVEKVKELITERPSYGTRRVAAQLSRELGYTSRRRRRTISSGRERTGHRRPPDHASCGRPT